MARKKNKKNRNNKNKQASGVNDPIENSVANESNTNEEEQIDTSSVTSAKETIVDSANPSNDIEDNQVQENNEPEVLEGSDYKIEAELQDENKEIEESNDDATNNKSESIDLKDEISDDRPIEEGTPFLDDEKETKEYQNIESADHSTEKKADVENDIAPVDVVPHDLNQQPSDAMSDRELNNVNDNKGELSESIAITDVKTSDAQSKTEEKVEIDDLADTNISNEDNDSFELDFEEADNMPELDEENLNNILNAEDPNEVSLTDDNHNLVTEEIISAENNTNTTSELDLNDAPEVHLEDTSKEILNGSLKQNLTDAVGHGSDTQPAQDSNISQGQDQGQENVTDIQQEEPQNTEISTTVYDTATELNESLKDSDVPSILITSMKHENEQKKDTEANDLPIIRTDSLKDTEEIVSSNDEIRSDISIKERETTGFSFEDVSLTKDDDKIETSASILDASSSQVPPLPSRSSAIAGQSLSEESEITQKKRRSFIPPILPLRRHEEKQPAHTVNAVPPPLSEEMKSPEFRKHFEKINKEQNSVLHRRSNKLSTSTSVGSPVESATADISLIANRLRVSSVKLDEFNPAVREDIQNGIDILKSSFSQILSQGEEIHKNILGVEEEFLDEEEAVERDEIRDTDWTFWTKVVNEFSVVANTDSDRLEREITNGIPRQIRGIMWQLIANSKSTDIEDIYNNLLHTESPHEAAIKRDLNRTNFIPDNKIDSLYNILKVYSVYDPAVGYTQGMAFMVTPLLLTCDMETEAFGLLVSLMKSYNLREFYLSGMPGLMLMLYQFDRLLEENSPRLANHLTREGIRSTMYTTQWFLTMFTYKFPYEFVLRIYDIIMFEGIESLLKFAVNAMIKNEDRILELKFDKLLTFLKDELFEYYSNDENGNDVEKSDQSLLRPIKLERINSNRSISNKQTHILANNSYNVNLFITDAMSTIHFTPLSLNRYKQEYESIQNLEKMKENELEKMRIKNEQLQREKDKLEHDFSILNEEHINMAKELIQNRLTIETIMDENNDLQATIDKLENEINEEIKRNEMPNPDAELPIDLKQDLERTVKRNEEVMALNYVLQDRLKEIDKYIEELKQVNKTFKPRSNSALYQDSSDTANSEENENLKENLKESENENENENGAIVADDEGPIDDIKLDDGTENHENKITSGFSSGWSGFKKVFKK